MSEHVDRRSFLKGVTAAGAVLGLRYGTAGAQGAVTGSAASYRRIEDVYRKKWTWDRVARGTHGTNCAGTCAFNVYVKNGIVWREEQQAEYGSSGAAPDYGPRGCQKGLRHAKYMYGKQRVLYPMKRVGERGEGKWERISWEQATTEIADRFIDYATRDGPQSIAFGTGTQMALKRASLAGLLRFANITGVVVPEFYSGVGDLPSGMYMTLGQQYAGDPMASVYHARCVLVWMSNPAVTRIPDAHFFTEARYNGTRVIAISPEFTPTAMHADYWINPRPGSDAALAMAMAHTIIEERRYKPQYMKEQTDLPLLVRSDTGRYLRPGDLADEPTGRNAQGTFFVWDTVAGGPARAPGAGGVTDAENSLALGRLQPALEGRWQISTPDGDVEVTTVFELVKARAAAHSPERVAEITGINPDVTVNIARLFADAEPAMIYAGYAACKWLHGDLLQRAMILLLSLTGNIGPTGGGLQFGNSARTGLREVAFADIGFASRGISATNWDYETGDMRALNAEVYGEELANEFDDYYQESLRRGWFPSHSDAGWKMGIFAGQNPANWRAAGKQWRDKAFEALECIVAMTPDMGITPFYADYVLPIAHHYERADIVAQSRIPYLQVLDVAVPPLGESADDWETIRRLSVAISKRALERGIEPIEDEINGRRMRRDYRQCEALYTFSGKLQNTRDVCQVILDDMEGLPDTSFDRLARQGIVRVNGSEGATWEGYDSPYRGDIINSVKEKKPYKTLTGRQQFYIDHEWFLEFDEALPGHKAPLRIDGYPLQMMMGHARHSVHSMWRDDSLLLSLQRGEPDIYVNPDDAARRDVADGDLIRIHNPAGEFFAIAHLSAGIQPGMLFMYHGWDPMMFRTRQNFGAVVCTGGLIKPTSMAGGYGHLGYRPAAFSPNQTYKDFTCDFDKAPPDLGKTA